jgi:hypothetical protein
VTLTFERKAVSADRVITCSTARAVLTVVIIATVASCRPAHNRMRALGKRPTGRFRSPPGEATSRGRYHRDAVGAHGAQPLGWPLWCRSARQLEDAT